MVITIPGYRSEGGRWPPSATGQYRHIVGGADLRRIHHLENRHGTVLLRWLGSPGTLEQGQARRPEVAVSTKGDLGYPHPPPTWGEAQNLRAVQLLLGHTKLESTVRYLGREVDDALEMAEQTEV
jgi:hypothetical protein